MKSFGLSLSAFLLATPISWSAPRFDLEKFEMGDDVIWSLEFLPSGELLFTEKKGKIRLWDPKTGKARDVATDLDPLAEGQGGLLDLVLHPGFERNSRIYWTQSVLKDGKTTTRLMRGTLKDGRLSNRETLLDLKAWSKTRMHYGSRIVFDREGFLYLAMGERNERHEAQKTDNHFGKVLRLTEDGKPAPGNPFADGKKGDPSVWSYGHRNPQGMRRHPETGEIWLGEHGPRGGDEINRIRSGLNYGWPVITYGREYWGPKIGPTHKEGLEQPVYHFTPSIAPSGLLIYSGKAFPEWKGSFFQGALVLQHLNRLEMKDGKPGREERLFTDLGERVRDVEESPEGWIYFSTDSGKIFRVLPKKDGKS